MCYFLSLYPWGCHMMTTTSIPTHRRSRGGPTVTRSLALAAYAEARGVPVEVRAPAPGRKLPTFVLPASTDTQRVCTEWRTGRTWATERAFCAAWDRLKEAAR